MMQYGKHDFFGELKTSKAVNVTQENFICLSSFIVVVWLRMAQDGFVSTIPPSGWIDSSKELSGTAKVAVEEQSLRHLPFACGHIHQKVVHQQWKIRNPYDLAVQRNVGKIKNLFFVGRQQALTAH